MTDNPDLHGNQQLIIFGDYESESRSVHEVVSAMNDAEIVQVSKSLLAGKLATPEVYGTRAYLPRSGRKLSIKQKSADAFILRATSQKERAKLSSEEHRSQKIELDGPILDDFLRLLRLVQLGLIAQSSRFSPQQIDDEKAPVPLSMTMITAMECLEFFVDEYSTGDRDELNTELKASLKAVHEYHEMWRSMFERSLKDADLRSNPENADLDLESSEYERRFCAITDDSDGIQPTDYLNEALDSSITIPISEVLFIGLRKLYVIETPEVRNKEVSWTVPPLRLVLNTDVDLYESQRIEAERLLSLLGTNQGDEQKDVRSLIKILQEKNVIKKLIDHPPSEISAKLDAILLNGNFDEVIRDRLEAQVPGVFNHLKKQKEPMKSSPKEVFTKTENLRNEVAMLERRLSRIDTQIESLRNAKGGQQEASMLQTKWSEGRGRLQQIKGKEQSIAKAVEEIESFRTEVLDLELSVKSKQTNVKTDGSVLWLGLGQAGQSILRECLLYCLDNLNDARCSALIRSLGIQDLGDLNNMMLRSKSSVAKTREQAEKELRRLFHRQLHVLAMNLGGEIDDLVMPGEPGYFLWGDEVPESEYASVRRKTMNTIKLDPHQDGAGGKTGVGRAFAFGRANELKDALRDTGSKNGNTPSHIIVTHSFAGGSGSGMVLPVLQLLRSMFDSDAMIWVVSVGEGLSEQRISADYNTPFILSDVLQAHYDGIHAAIDPFRIGEWSGYKTELLQYVSRMDKELNGLKSLLSDDSKGLDALKKTNASKSHQVERAREESKAMLEALISNVDGSLMRWVEVDLEKQAYELLPVNDDETEAFNSWCDVYDENGERPAVKFWNAWVNHVVDPLGSVVDCREKGKEQRNKSNSPDDYVPNITSAHIQVALDEAKKKLFPPDSSNTTTVVQNKPERDHQNLRMLVFYLVNQIDSADNSGGMEETFAKAQQILENYGREVDGFNALRRDLTNRVKALSKAGNDRGVKSIVISNAHLERGVSKSKIPVEENTYTVYNAVVFDVIMNIIGSQLPSTDYISGKMEYFDRTDLDNHSLPPMAVGLLQQNDALSLAEPPVTSLESSSKAKSIKSNIHSTRVFDELFGSNTGKLTGGKTNPFSSNGFAAGGKPSMFFESYFGIRTQSMLHINPYDVIGVNPSKELQELTDAVEQNWDMPGEKITNIDYGERQAFVQDGFTSTSMSNMLRWLSLLDPESLKQCLGLQGFNNPEQMESIREKLPTKFLFSEAEKNFELTRYELESGSISVNEYGPQFMELGILNEELLAFAPPALLNSYLPLRILSKQQQEIVEAFVPSKAVEQFQAVLKSVMPSLIKHYQPTNVYDPIEIQDFLSIAKMERSSLKNAFAEVNLEISIVEKDDRETIAVRLHPRLVRYLSVFRDAVSKKSSVLFPSVSVASSFSRYLAADSSDHAIGTYSSPTFSRASEDMERLAFMGLLPDEQRLSWPSFLRMMLFSSLDAPGMNRKLGSLSESVELHFPAFIPLVEAINEKNPLEDLHMGASETPDSVVHLGKTIQARMLSFSPIENEYERQRAQEKHTVDHWKARMAMLKEEEIEVYDEPSLRYFVQFLLKLVKEEASSVPNGSAVDSTTSSEEEAGHIAVEPTAEDQSQTSESHADELQNDLLSVDRLLYEIATNLSEMLSQAEYMSKEHSADRVHFKMSGFSDRLVGKPKGLLIQVHTASTYREDFDMAKMAIRESIQQSLGVIGSSKEFQTKSNFGPRASVTVSLSQAPLNEAGTTYRGLMKKLAGSDPDSYIEETKLHPYVFLYNVLWLSARLDKWTNLGNTGFARQFVIPLQVIQDHYTNPNRIEGAVNALVKDSIFLKGVSLPQDDIRDYTSSKKSEERYRSIPHLVSLLALRHLNTCLELEKQVKDETFSENIREIQSMYEEEIRRLREDPVLQRDGEARKGVAHTLLLEGERIGGSGSGNSSATDSDGSDDPMAALMAALGNEDDAPGTSDTIVERTKAWFEAHKAWNTWVAAKDAP